MTLFDILERTPLTDDQWEAWAKTAYFPTSATLRTLGGAHLGWDWYVRHTADVADLLAGERLRPSLVAAAVALGLEPALVAEILDAESVKGGRVDDRRRGLLGALYWAYLDERRGRRPGSVSRAARVAAFDDGILARKFNLPGVILLGDGFTRFGQAGDGPPTLTTRWETAVWGPHTDPMNQDGDHPELQEWFGWLLWARGWLELDRRAGAGKSAWNGTKARLRLVTQVDDENSHILHMQPTSYVAQLATTFCWREWVKFAHEEGADARRAMAQGLESSIRQREIEIALQNGVASNPELAHDKRSGAARKAAQLSSDVVDIRAARDRVVDAGFPRAGLTVAARARRDAMERAYREHRLDGSRLANALSINVAVISKDNRFYLQRRNAARVGEGAVDWQTTGAGFVDPDKDCDAMGVPSIWRTMTREVREEFGWELSAQALGVFWEGRKREVGVLALARSDRAAADIGVPSVETTEVIGFRAVPFDNPADILEFACAESDPDAEAGGRRDDAGAVPRVDGATTTGPWANFMALGAASIVFGLVANLGGTPDHWLAAAEAFDAARRRPA